MSEPLSPSEEDLSPTLGRQVDHLCNQFEAAWRSGERPRIEDLLLHIEEPARPFVLPELIALDIEYRRQAGENVAADDYRGRFPNVAEDWLDEALSASLDLGDEAFVAFVAEDLLAMICPSHL